MDDNACDSRTHTYRNGKTFEQCRQEARVVTGVLVGEIAQSGEVAWFRVLEAAGHDEIVYKLTLKYLREKGFDIGNFQAPQVKQQQQKK
ncbi:hypothetical protein NTE_03258 [Candidatus Nitrososphaera evergladensis SR1]|uniref:Uncharacterized protein n=1 Tax=Candidatus Nitrososphaera evergladensis SR1 TaxID=1459636 RepID=A0A075MXE4_9ARCH|nr:hypothetical protein [Candidatus Nitrososphaera evergladensis]AIF85287.1 hypothetical protein NTE_03258 [Candidatus Nitrososphaera evergladensis SR1]